MRFGAGAPPNMYGDDLGKSRQPEMSDRLAP